MTDINKIVQGFPHPTIPPIMGAPIDQMIIYVNTSLSSNSTSIHSNRGTGTLGYLFFAALPNTYRTQVGVDFLPPTNLGATAHVPIGSTELQISTI